MLPKLVGRADDGSDVVVHPPLSQAVGYIVVVVIGLVIAASKYHNTPTTLSASCVLSMA